jgi:carboxyl-terminal processing protease
MVLLIRVISILAITLAAACIAPASPQEPIVGPQIDTVVDEVWRIVKDNFHDPALNGVGWAAARSRCHSQCRYGNVPQHINAMLAKLGASHTQLYQVGTTQYYELLDIYRSALGDELKRLFPAGTVQYVGLGAATIREREALHRIVDAYDGGPADAAGLLRGDLVLFVDPSPLTPRRHCGTVRWTLVDSAMPHARDTTMTFLIERRAGSREEVQVTPELIVPHEMFLKSMRASARVIEREGRRLAYVRLRSWAGEEYQNLLIALLNAEPLRSCDGLILDIRGGWGGANPEDLSIFGCEAPMLEMSNREGQTNRIPRNADLLVPADKQWRKPVTLLIDEGTRSGKEIFTYGFKKAGRGKVVGTRTAGAVLGGRPFLLSDGNLLVVAVSDVRVDGVRLEGVGVEPDVVVERGPIESSAGADPQLDKAVSVLAESLAAGN